MKRRNGGLTGRVGLSQKAQLAVQELLLAAYQRYGRDRLTRLAVAQLRGRQNRSVGRAG